MECRVKGCTNRSDEGRFIGEFCSPCYEMLGSGSMNHSEAWFVKEINKTSGQVVVTTNEDGECVLVSRQDEDHNILKVIWEKK